MEFYVYKHTCQNEKIYIGITKQQPIKRWGYNGYGYRKNTLFYRAIQKYGWSNIKHEILYENLSKEEAEQKEIELIAQYKSNQKKYGYNIENGRKCASSIAEQTKKQISNKLKGIVRNQEFKNKISCANKKRWIEKSNEEKEKEIERLKNLNIGRTPWNKGKKGLQKHTEEWKKQASERMKKYNEKNMKKVLCVETNIIYNSLNEASRILNISQGNISMCLCGKRNIAGGYHWQYVS